jgi:hypothetical protein
MRLPVKCPSLLSSFFQNWNVSTNLYLPNIKFYENPFSGCRSVTGGHTEVRTNMAKVIDAFLQLSIANRIPVTKTICFICKNTIAVCSEPCTKHPVVSDDVGACSYQRFLKN